MPVTSLSIVQTDLFRRNTSNHIILSKLEAFNFIEDVFPCNETNNKNREDEMRIEKTVKDIKKVNGKVVSKTVPVRH